MARTVYLQVSIDDGEWDAFAALSPAEKLAFVQQRALAKAAADIQAEPPEVVQAAAALLTDSEKQAAGAAVAAVQAVVPLKPVGPAGGTTPGQ